MAIDCNCIQGRIRKAFQEHGCVTVIAPSSVNKGKKDSEIISTIHEVLQGVYGWNLVHM